MEVLAFVLSEAKASLEAWMILAQPRMWNPQLELSSPATESISHEVRQRRGFDFALNLPIS